MKKLDKLFLSGIIAGSMILGSVGVFANTNQQVVKVKIGSNVANVNGQNVTMDAMPYIQKTTNVTMIPLRFVATALGIPDSNVIYNAEAKSAKIITDERDIHYLLNWTMGNYGYAELKNGRTYIPLRALCNDLNLSVEWDNITKTATMKSNVSLVNNTVNTTTNSNQNNNQAQTSSTALTEQEVRAMEEEVVRLVNEERAKYGVKPLEIKEDLMQSARAKSEDMAKRDYYSHTDPDGYAMYKKTANAENLGATNTPEEVVNGWMNSEGHRKNMLNPNYKYIGVGLAYGKATWWYDDNNDHPYWTQHFSR